MTDASSEIEAIADEVLGALDRRCQISSLCQRMPGFDLKSAYRVAAAIRAKREARGENAIGRKLGFTNANIWAEYGVYAPIWGYVYDSTVVHINPLRYEFALSAAVEPRIEPEITLAFKSAPEPGMDEAAILECIEWVAHGFEVVQSLFPGWQFQAPDTVAAFGLHGALLLGPKLPVTGANRRQWLKMLSNFDVSLACNGNTVDQGHARNVLGGPLSALRNVIAVLQRDDANPPLAGGEIVTTGTITRAFPMQPSEVWTTTFHGAPFAGLRIALL